MDKVVKIEKALELMHDNQTYMIGGFLACGTPEKIIDALIAKNVTGMTVISNDTSFADRGIGKLVVSGQVKKVITSHIGTNKESGIKMNNGEMEVDLVPQGTLAERIRSQGVGLGGVLTPTGVGTVIEKDKQIIESNGKKYLLELPLKADIALIKANKADRCGNLVYKRSARNFNPLMAMAADKVIVEAEKIVEIGELDPDEIVTPGIFVDMIIETEGN